MGHVVLRARSVLVVALLVLVPAVVSAQVHDFVRVGTYNIKFLNTGVVDEGDRLQKLRATLDALDADVLGLQEIEDRAALHVLFPPSQHDIIIDDNSGDKQDVAVVVRRPCIAQGQTNPPIFVFAGSTHETAFPKRRDLLRVTVSCPQAPPFTIFVHHAKARVGGRHTTEPRRIDASRKILAFLRNPDEFSDRLWVILGDFNDNPDDASANILETGNPNAPGREENDPDTFAVNLTETLLRNDNVSHGLHTGSIQGDTVNTRVPGSRKQNNDLRGTDQVTGPILFDQILISQDMAQAYLPASVAVFNRPEAVRGNRHNRASDHAPVSADFRFAAVSAASTNVVISRLLPNPTGRDVDDESITLKNKGNAVVSLQGWALEDADGHLVRLDGLAVGANAQIVVVRRGSPLSLNNNGDTVRLRDSTGTVKSERTYTASQVAPNREIVFE